MGFGLLGSLAKSALTSVISPYIDDAKNVALNAGKSAVLGTIAGKMSVQEWAELLIVSVDELKDKLVEQSGYSFVGGQLIFSITESKPSNIVVSFALYFQDNYQKWQKAEADSMIPSTMFTEDAIAELINQKKIVFEVK